MARKKAGERWHSGFPLFCLEYISVKREHLLREWVVSSTVAVGPLLPSPTSWSEELWLLFQGLVVHFSPTPEASWTLSCLLFSPFSFSSGSLECKFFFFNFHLLWTKIENCHDYYLNISNWNVWFAHSWFPKALKRAWCLLALVNIKTLFLSLRE